MRCDEFEQILDQELTGPYPDSAAAHLDECEPCRALSAELAAIRMAGHALGEQDAEELEAPDHVWYALSRQLREEGIIREPAVRDRTRSLWWSVFRRPAIASASLSLVLVAGALVSFQKDIAPSLAARVRKEIPAVASATIPGALDVSDQLQTELNETVSELPRQDAVLANSIRRDMDLIDSSIAICEKSVREQPGNEIAREYLYGAYQQKAELLDAAMNRSMTGGLQ